MTADEYREAVEFEDSLEVGDTVTVRWTCCGTAYAASAMITKINKKSFITSLNTAVGDDEGGYPKGNRIKAPRITDLRGWTVNNRIEPTGGYKADWSGFPSFSS